MSASSSSLIALFDSICRNYGEYDAVTDSNSLSTCYLEIQQASNLLADQLVFRFGRPDIVLLDLNRAAAAELAAIIACLRLGIVFVPVDGTDPFRLRQIVEHLLDTKVTTPTIAAIVLAANDADPRLSSFFHADVHFCLLVNERGDMVEPMTVPSLSSIPPSRTHTLFDEDDMYILFTSGTTSDGSKLKAVIGSRSQTLRRLCWFADVIQQQEPGETTIIARRTPLTFVDGVHELLSILLTTHGDHTPGTLYCSEDLHELALHSTRITMLPSQLGQVLSSSLRSPLQVVIVSGEPCPPSIIEQFRAAKQRGDFAESVRLFNFYGQTETVGDVCFASLLDQQDVVQDTVPIGRPLPGVSVRLDEDTNEVIVTGGSFANGYYSNRGESSSSLCPFHTGDVGFYVGDCFYVRGRMGDVQKVNGVLTSPTEIETRFHQVFGDNCSCAATIQQGSPYVLVVDGTMKKDFSREKMLEQQVPWHLIPKEVFFIPRSVGLPRTSSGKLQRTLVKSIVTERLSKRDGDNEGTTPSQLESDPLLQAVASVLRLPLTADIIQQMRKRTFIDLGGDSHMAVALWHKLRGNDMLHEPITIRPIDLLEAGTVEDIRLILTLGPSSNKKRKKASGTTRHKVSSLVEMSDLHCCAQFSGCVDAAPICLETFIYAACQGGEVQRFSLSPEQAWKDKAVDSISINGGWRIQASLTPIEGSIIACCHHVSNSSGLVVCATESLDRILWQRQIPHGIKATPILQGGHVFAHAGKMLVVLETLNGNIVAHQPLNGASECSPASLAGGKYLYAYSDWGANFQVVDVQDPQNITCESITNDPGAPIQADLLVLGPNRVIAVDVMGCIHDIDTDNGTVQSFKISNAPFSGAPTKTTGGDVVLGGQDGIVRCLQQSNLSNVLWKVDLGVVIRCKVLPIHESAFVVCTTAGNVFLVNATTSRTAFRKVGQVGGEIWSNPLQVACEFSNQQTNMTCIAFGARDSRLHVISFE